MYEITIKNFYQNGVLNRNEQTLYHIPIQDGEKENVLTDPSVSRELGKTGTMEFTIHPNHPYYHAIAQMRTIMRVDYDGDTIFRGRVLTIDNTMSGAKRIHCEGDMAFLLDSIQMGTKKESRSTKTLNAYIQEVLNNHNAQMQESGENDKCIYPGYIPGAYPSGITSTQQIENKSDTFGSNSTEQSMNALESLTKEFGGFFRTRYSASEQKTYLDWCRNWFRYDTQNKQPIAITQNIIDANSNSEVDNIFTALIPIGSKEGEDVFITDYRTDIHGNNNRILVPQITQVFSESELSTGYMTKALYAKAVEQYGIIYKTQSFSNADTPDKLWTYACDWIKNNYVGGITSYDLSAIDMHHVDNMVAKYLDGDRVELSIPSDMTELDEYNSNNLSNTVNRTLLSIKYDLHHPDKNSYTAGIPSDILNVEYGIKSTSKSKASGGGGKGAGGKGGGDNRDKLNEEQKRKAREKAQEALAWKLIWDETYNNRQYAKLKEQAGGILVKPALQTSQVIVKQILSDPQIDTPKELCESVSLVLDGQNAKLQMGLSPIGRTIASAKKLSDVPLAYRNLLLQHQTYQKAVASMSINAGNKAMEITGKNSDIADSIVNKAISLGLARAKNEDEASTIINQAMNSATVFPKTVGKFGSNTDSSGNESGFMDLAKEGLTNLSMNAGGNGGKGTAEIGKKNGEWLVQMNKPLQYTVGGVTYTLPDGAIDSREISMLRNTAKPIASFSTQFAEIDTAILNRATIGQLDAAKARISDLEADTANIKSLISDYAQIKKIISGEAQTTKLWCNTLSVYTINDCYNLSFKGHTISTKNALAPNGTDIVHVLGY